MEVTNSLLLLSFIGLISLLKLSLPLLHWLYATFLRPPKDLKRAYGPWAVVTGATDGIGRAIAVELARRGLHLILVGRSPSKLTKASDIILGQCHDTQVRTVVWDLGVGGDCDGAERLRQAVAGVEVGVLVNSAGATYPGAAFFHEVEERVWREVVGVNVEGMCHVTRLVLPGMVSRRRGAVVNVGSASSVAVPSFPFYAVYAATKAYKRIGELNVYPRLGTTLDVGSCPGGYIEFKGSSLQMQATLTVLTNTREYSPDLKSILALSTQHIIQEAH